mgnify:CR=1 FL=1
MDTLVPPPAGTALVGSMAAVACTSGLGMARVQPVEQIVGLTIDAERLSDLLAKLVAINARAVTAYLNEQIAVRPFDGAPDGSSLPNPGGQATTEPH